MNYSHLKLLSNRRLFDPSKTEDLLELKYFVENNRWIGNCPFYLEEYWDNIPTMCLYKYAVYMLGSVKKPIKNTVKKKIKVSVA
jgi:hypothetical protein